MTTYRRFRYTFPVKREFASEISKVMGAPIRESLDGDVISAGIIVGWVDQGDYIDLIVESREIWEVPE